MFSNFVLFLMWHYVAICIITDQFSGPGRTFGLMLVCLSACTDNNVWTKVPAISIFVALVHLDSI